MKRIRPIALSLLLLISIVLTSCFTPSGSTISLDSIPEYSGVPFVHINDGVPSFTEEDYTTVSYEFYSELDALGR